MLRYGGGLVAFRMPCSPGKIILFAENKILITFKGDDAWSLRISGQLRAALGNIASQLAHSDLAVPVPVSLSITQRLNRRRVEEEREVGHGPVLPRSAPAGAAKQGFASTHRAELSAPCAFSIPARVGMGCKRVRRFCPESRHTSSSP